MIDSVVSKQLESFLTSISSIGSDGEEWSCDCWGESKWQGSEADRSRFWTRCSISGMFYFSLTSSQFGLCLPIRQKHEDC